MIQTLLTITHLRYLTLISMILCVAHRYTHPYVNLYYLTLVVFIIGSYLFWIQPRTLVVPLADSNNLVLQGNVLKAVDIAFHILPFLFVSTCYASYYLKKHKYDHSFVMALLLVTFYAFAFNPEKLYGLPMELFVHLFTITTIVYILL